MMTALPTTPSSRDASTDNSGSPSRRERDTQQDKHLPARNDALRDQSLNHGHLQHAETCHRVKNNLAVVVSLLSLQARDASEPAVASQIKDAAHRVEVMCSLYDQLSQETGPSVCGLAYLKKLSGSLAAALSLPGKELSIEVAGDAFSLSSTLAANLGLIVNELVTNAYKHFNAATACKVEVRLSKEADTLRLEVRDNGPGLPADFGSRHCDSLGVKLVRSLVHQHGGTCAWSSAEGTRVLVNFPCS